MLTIISTIIAQRTKVYPKGEQRPAAQGSHLYSRLMPTLPFPDPIPQLYDASASQAFLPGSTVEDLPRTASTLVSRTHSDQKGAEFGIFLILAPGLYRHRTDEG